jgi:hypothetical protein
LQEDLAELAGGTYFGAAQTAERLAEISKTVSEELAYALKSVELAEIDVARCRETLSEKQAAAPDYVSDIAIWAIV